VTIKPITESLPKNQPFLPVKSLSVAETFDEEKPEISVNKALTRRFEVRAMGSLPSFLPVIKAQSVKSSEVYSESGTKAQEKSDEGLLASLNFSQVYLPTEAGPVHIPEQVVYWWDTEHDQLKTATIRAFQFNVIPEAVIKPDSHPEPLESPPKQIKSWPLWQLLTILFALLWLATLVFIYITKKPKYPINKNITNKQDHLMTLIAQVKRACESGSLPEVLSSLRELLAWASLHEEGRGYQTQISIAINKVEDVIYGRKDILIVDVLSEVKKYIGEIKSPGHKKETLPALYPF